MSRVLILLALAGAALAALQWDARSAPEGSAELLAARQTGNGLFRRGDMAGAAAAYARGAQLALCRGERRQAARLLSNESGARLAAGQYRQAIRCGLEARSLAAGEGDTLALAAVYTNLASIHAQMGDADAAAQWVAKAIRLIGNGDPFGTRGQVFTLYADQLASLGRLSEALPFYEDALRSAQMRGDQRVLAQLWDHYGLALLNARKLEGADAALTESFRIRTLGRVPGLDLSLIHLSRLRLAEGDSASAFTLANHAAATGGSGSVPPDWNLPLARAHAELALGRRNDALADLRRAVRIFEVWTWSIAAADSFRETAGFRGIYDQLIDADLNAAPHFPLEAFATLERARADSMREALAQSAVRRAKLPDEYWRLLTQLRAALAVGGASSAGRIRSLRTRALELEAITVNPVPAEATPGERSGPAETLTSVRRRLGPDEALLSFHAGSKSSWLWTVTRSSFSAHRLPPPAELASLVQQWRLALENSAPEQVKLGRRVYRTLFGKIGAEVEKAPSWVIEADDRVFEIPFSALVVNSPGRPLWLVERHATRTISGAAIAESQTEEPSRGTFVGIADGIYNEADERLDGAPGLAMAAVFSIPGDRQLPRLPGSGSELRRAARAWGARQSVLLTGSAATRANLLAAVASRPEVLHIATHVLHPSVRPADALLDFGVDGHGSPSVLSADDIASLSLPGSVVVMSGCASAGGGDALGAVTAGLTRAWFLAGARAVVGTKRATTDGNGALFESFYRWLRITRRRGAKGAASRAMQLAALEMLHSSSWKAAPSYWAEFYVIEKD